MLLGEFEWPLLVAVGLLELPQVAVSESHVVVCDCQPRRASKSLIGCDGKLIECERSVAPPSDIGYEGEVVCGARHKEVVAISVGQLECRSNAASQSFRLPNSKCAAPLKSTALRSPAGSPRRSRLARLAPPGKSRTHSPIQSSASARTIRSSG